MIVLMTPQGLIHMPLPQPDDATTIQGQCEHAISLFEPCFDCIWIENYQRFYPKQMEACAKTGGTV